MPVFRLDSENKQLQVIISQLRSNRRNNKDEVDSIILERNQLKESVEAQKDELTKLRIQVNDNIRIAETNYSASLLGELESLKKVYQATNQELHEYKSSYSLLEQRCHQIQSSHDVFVSDHLGLKQDLANRETELNNMRSIVHQLEEQYKSQLGRFQAEQQSKLKAQEQELKRKHDKIMEEFQIKFDEQSAQLKEAKQKIETEMLLRRKAEVEMRRDKKKMEAGFESTLKQMQNSNIDNMVDRTLVANLIVSYIQRRR